jgi:hypothetical protein
MKKSIFLFNLLSILIFSQSVLAYQNSQDFDNNVAEGSTAVGVKVDEWRTQTFSFNNTSQLSFKQDEAYVDEDPELVLEDIDKEETVVEKPDVLTHEIIGDWQFIGGESNTPPYIWVESDFEKDKVIQNLASYFRSRVYSYTYVCQLDSKELKKPSFIDLKEINKEKNKVDYKISLLDENKKNEEVEIEIRQKANCQLFYSILFIKNKRIRKRNMYLKKVLGGINSLEARQEVFTNKIIFNTKDLESKKEESYGKTISENNVQNKNLLLESLFVDENQLKPKFNSNYFYYQVELDRIATASPSIIASAYDSNSEVTIDSPEDLNSNNRKERTAYISVISPDQKSRKTYTIVFSYKKQKNYLLDLSSTLGKLNPQFSKYKNNYQVDLSKRKDLFVNNKVINEILKSIKATSENSSDKVTIMPIDFKPNKSLTISISLVSSDKLKSNQYYITFFAEERMWYF